MPPNPYCFVIMPINNCSTEPLWEDVYNPVIQECGFAPDRIDRSEDGSDLSPQILKKIVNASLIVADLTMERQNCYFELGYALGKIPDPASIIICCREDHHPRSPNYRNDGPQVHFDLSGRNIIFWDDNSLEIFKSELKKKIESRVAQIRLRQAEPEQEAEKTMRNLNLSSQSELSLNERLIKAREELEGE